MVLIPIPMNFLLWLVKLLLSNEGCDVCKPQLTRRTSAGRQAAAGQEKHFDRLPE